MKRNRIVSLIMTDHLAPAADQSESGRSRLTPEREAELFTVVLDLLVETGYEALTMDAVSHRAHVSKATIYRQWGGKPRLVATALRQLKRGEDDFDTGSLRGDLVALARAIGSVAETNSHLVAAVGHAVTVDPELALAMRECMLEPNNEKFGTLLARAIERGEIRADNPALAHVPALLLSTMLSRPIIEGRTVDEAYLVGLVDAVVLPALTGRAGPAVPLEG